jgi:hypothetical protein
MLLDSEYVFPSGLNILSSLENLPPNLALGLPAPPPPPHSATPSPYATEGVIDACDEHKAANISTNFLTISKQPQWDTLGLGEN